jgi:hypothetical protein
MMIIMKPNATPEQIEHVIQHIREAGLNVHLSQGVEATVIGAVGEAHSIPTERFEGLDGVEALHSRSSLPHDSFIQRTPFSLSTASKLAGVRLSLSPGRAQ